MRITSKGRVTIPVEIREKAGFLPGTEVDFLYERGKVVIRKHEDEGWRGDRLVAQLRGKGSLKMTTEEIMSLMRGDA